MIFKCSDAYAEKPLIINRNLLDRYKTEGDDYLISIYSQLSRSLVDYKLFQELQKVNNDYYVIVDGLQCEKYTQIKSLLDDKGKLLNSINIFTRHCKNSIDSDIYEALYSYCDKLMLMINKLIEIVNTVNN